MPTLTKNRLLELRQERRLSQQALEVQAGVNRVLISTIERNSYLPTQPVREKLAKALGVTERDIWPEAEFTVVR
jgi:transcriptional regulator with XRE-family HTH domain